MQSFESLRMLRELLGTEGLRLVLDLPLLFYALVLTAAIDLRLLAVVMAALAAQLAAALVVLPRLRTKAREELAAGADARTRLVETIGGVATLRAAGDSRSGLWRWLPAFVREVRAGADQDGALLAVMAVVEALRQLSLLVIVWWGPAASSAASSASEG
jgi:ABC-type bacteriocin/lantibiotic exporter with double-glycine peptidase domain